MRSVSAVLPGYAVVAASIASLALAGCSSSTGAAHAPATPAGSSRSAATTTTSAAAASTASLRVETTALGKVLADVRGFTVYTFAHDRPGASACTGACAQTWPPVAVGEGSRLVGPASVPGRFATIVRSGGGGQATFDGHPLYRYSGDAAPGQTHGQGIEHAWFVVRVAGTSHPAPTATGSTTHTGAVPPPGHTTSHRPGPSSTHAAPPTHPHPSSTHPSPHPSSTHPSPHPSSTPANCIPQGGGGDGDGDNNGGPSDGDGCT